MAGPWNPSNPPIRPGGYVNWRAAVQPVIPPNLASIVCIPFTHDWGPYKTPVLVTSWAQWQQIFGTDDTPGSRAVKQAFFGEGLPGYGGAGAVLSYRFGTATGSPAAAAAVSINKTGGAAALTLTAKYAGTRANRLSVTVQTNAADNTRQDVVIYDGATAIESYTFQSTPANNTPVANVAALINAQSQFVTATVASDGATLINGTGSAFTGGADGATLTAADWTAMLAAVGPQRFGFFAPFDLTDNSIHASIVSWIQGLNNSGKRVRYYSGGVLNELLSSAIARAQAANDPNVNTIGEGSVVDVGVVGTPQAPVVLSTSQLAPRIAGIAAARGSGRPLTYARLSGLTFSASTPTGTVAGVAPSDFDVVQAIQNGVMVITADSNPVSPLRIEKGVSTWQSSNTDVNRPYSIYSVPRFVNIMAEFEMNVVQFIEQQVITPGLPMTQATREFVLGKVQAMLQTMIDSGLIQAGAQAAFDATMPTSPTDNFLSIAYTWLFTRSVEQVRNTIQVG